MTDRAHAATESAATLRLEGLDAGPEVEGLLRRWVAGELSEEDLLEAERLVLARQPLGDLLAPAGAPRAA